MNEKPFPVLRVVLWTPFLVLVAFLFEALVDLVSVGWISYSLCWLFAWGFVGIGLYAGGAIEKTKSIEVRHLKPLEGHDYLSQPYHLHGTSRLDMPTGEYDYVEGDPIAGWVWSVIWPLYGLCYGFWT